LPNKLTDKSIKAYSKALVKVMEELEAEVLAFMVGAGTTTPAAAAAVLNSRPEFIKFLNDSGYNDLSRAYIKQYEKMTGAVELAFNKRLLPPPVFSTVSAETFAGLAQMDLQNFSSIGTKAMDDLRMGIYRNTVAGANFKDTVNLIKASTVGLDGKGSALANHSYTHANTAILNFQGEVVQKAGESIGFDGDDSLWELVHVMDAATRDICVDAYTDPVRTRAEWLAIDYFGGSPGGYNCRGILYPYIN